MNSTDPLAGTGITEDERKKLARRLEETLILELQAGAIQSERIAGYVDALCLVDPERGDRVRRSLIAGLTLGQARAAMRAES